MKNRPNTNRGTFAGTHGGLTSQAREEQVGSIIQFAR